MTVNSRSSYGVFLAIVVSLVGAVGAVGGFFVGRSTGQDAYVQKVSSLIATENRVMTLSAALGAQVDDPTTAEALEKLYEVRIGDRDALVRRLRGIAWVPPYRPAPFVGHLARPTFGGDLHINVLGFRDLRQGYLTKPERTVRIFITGGSTAWGSGAPSQKQTIPSLLERILNERISPRTGYRYEVINTAFPAWTTTQEKLLIQQRLVDMHPDVILMFSGTNDIHWARYGQDIRWLYGPEDQNYLMLLNELYRSSGHADWTVVEPVASRPIQCPELARITARNVEEAAFAASGVGARLIFALQPNIATTAKRLTRREQQLPEAQNRPYWGACYRDLLERLGRVRAQNYRFVDLSRSLGELDDSTEVFIDSYHFAGLGNRILAAALADNIDWRSITPSAAVKSKEALAIVSFEATESALRVVPNRFDKNLLAVFDETILPTTVGNDDLRASMPASLTARSGAHSIFLVDGMTGETSAPVVFRNR